MAFDYEHDDTPGEARKFCIYSSTLGWRICSGIACVLIEQEPDRLSTVGSISIY